MKIVKEAAGLEKTRLSEDDLRQINAFSKKKLTNDEIFTFEILLCDNEVDREHERFATDALKRLAELFVGKTGIFDHEWSAGKQVARIYKTEVVTDSGRTTAGGEPYAYLKAWAYMLREGNEELVAAIEGGITREVSVGCSMGKALCSLCGEEIGTPKCGDVRGGEHDGRLCCAILTDARDAYEWSFVAVPAQRNAGVLKKLGGSERPDTLEKCIRAADDPAVRKEYAYLAAMARAGEAHIKELRREVVRLGMLADSGFEGTFLEKLAAKLDEEELTALKAAFDRRVEELYPPVCQLGNRAREERSPDVGDFLI